VCHRRAPWLQQRQLKAWFGKSANVSTIRSMQLRRSKFVLRYTHMFIFVKKMFCLPAKSWPTSAPGSDQDGNAGVGTRRVRRVIGRFRVSRGGGKGKLVKEKKNVPGTCTWDVCGESGIISLPGPSRRTRRGRMTDYRAAGVSFFTAWA
jgi:hypothetical protein